MHHHIYLLDKFQIFFDEIHIFEISKGTENAQGNEAVKYQKDIKLRVQFFPSSCGSYTIVI